MSLFNIFTYIWYYNVTQLHYILSNPAQKVSGHKVSKIDKIGQKVSSQKYPNKDNKHYYYSYNIINSVVGSKPSRNIPYFI